ncbi:MAG: hypothetical protein ACTSO7_06230 [Candidatus Heimdallarchaeota archaeon]
MNKLATSTGLGKKTCLTIRILVISVLALALVIPTIGYANATHDYYVSLPVSKERVDEVPIPIHRVPFKVIPEDKTENPDDWDNDGLTNIEERFYRTNPQHNDSDWDGLIDGAEVYVYHTSPSVSDSDGDFIIDSHEIFKYFTNPNKKDTDGDNLDDGMEIFIHFSNPFIKDSDFDLIDDYDEINVYKTDVNNYDTDQDGIKDGLEIFTYRTNPTNADTDGDGLYDLWEINNNHNPLVKDNLGSILGYYVILPSLSLLVIIFGIVSSVGARQKFMFRFTEPRGYLDPKFKDKQYIFDLISLMPEDKQITVEDLMEFTGLSKYEVQHLLLTLFDDEDYDETSLDDCVIFTTPKSCLSLFSCFYCGASITNKMNVCPECHEEIVRCALCSMPIEHRDSFATCTSGGMCGTENNVIAYIAIEHLCEGCTMRSKYDFI